MDCLNIFGKNPIYYSPKNPEDLYEKIANQTDRAIRDAMLCGAAMAWNLASDKVDQLNQLSKESQGQA